MTEHDILHGQDKGRWEVVREWNRQVGREGGRYAGRGMERERGRDGDSKGEGSQYGNDWIGGKMKIDGGET